MRKISFTKKIIISTIKSIQWFYCKTQEAVNVKFLFFFVSLKIMIIARTNQQQRYKDYCMFHFFLIISRPLKSCFLKSPFLRNVVIKPHSAAFFNKSPKNPHGSFEVICSRSQQYIDSISEDPFIKVAPKTTF